METIEIHAAQAIREYELASLLDRALAFMIDVSLMLVFCAGMYWLLMTYDRPEADLYDVGAYCLPIILVYSLLFESLNRGQSVGKYIMNIRVMKIDGTRGAFSDYAVRWAFRLLDLYLSIGTFAIVLVSVTEYNQRLGDLVARTVVVKN
jgi:uncharacterized RDD family membrane protein YckC